MILAVSLPVTKDVYICLPSTAAVVFFAASAYLIFRRATQGDYLVVSGICQSIELSTMKRKVKSIVLLADGQTIQVMLQGRMRKIAAGAAIDLYLAKNAPIYEKDGKKLLYSYIAIDIVNARG